MNLKGHANLTGENTGKKRLISSPEAWAMPLLALRACQTGVLKTELSLPSNYILGFQKLCGVHMNSAQWTHTGWPGSAACLHTCARLHPAAPASGQVQAEPCTPAVQGAESR